MRRLALFLLCACALSSCADAGQSWVELGGKRYSVEIASTDEARARGLMFRDAMPETHGMIFIHDEQAPQSYWMKNTKIPLDILYFDNDRKLVAQQRDVPPLDPRRAGGRRRGEARDLGAAARGGGGLLAGVGPRVGRGRGCGLQRGGLGRRRRR